MVTLAADKNLRIEKLKLEPFGTNAYIVVCQLSGDSVLVDAPGEPDQIIAHLKETNPKYILLTHSHSDHTGALTFLHSKLEIPVAAHPLDIRNLPLQPEVKLSDGDTVAFGKARLKVLHTPGHTPGSVCFVTSRYLLSGDTIFPAGPGKTRSPQDLKQIIKSITTKIFTLPDDTEVYPGHGEPTILSKEKGEFAVFSSRSHPSDLCGDVLWLSS